MDETTPQQREIAVASVKRLREDQDLADELYQDTETPADATDRQRVYLGNIADKTDEPASVAVLPIATGSRAFGGGVFSRTFLTQVSIEYEESHYERYGALSMYSIRDRCGAVLSGSVTPSAVPLGPEGGDSIAVNQDLGTRTLTNRFRVQVNSHDW